MQADSAITIELINLIITAARALRDRDFSSPEVKESLIDLWDDEDFDSLIYEASYFAGDRVIAMRM